jgi:aspartyl-tRNA(Asn)/glutamyl-tRNA(Gln) amidotransferase subunit A
VKSAVRAALTSLQGLGASVEEVAVPETQYRSGAVFAILYSEASTIHERWLRAYSGEYGADVLERLRHGQRLTATQYLRGQQARRALMDRFRIVFEDIDVLATPTVPILAPTLPESRGPVARGQLLGFTQLFNVLGLPAVSVPCGFSRNGLPIGLQLVGRPFEEETILRAAHAYEQAAGWYKNRPAV